MTGNHEAPRRGDPATRWMVGGTVVSFAMMLTFIAAMADQMRSGDAGGRAPMVLLVLFGVAAFGALTLGPIGRAVAKRLLEKGRDGDVDQVLGEMDDLRLQTDDLRHALAEAQERLDFTERLLAGSKERIPEELH